MSSMSITAPPTWITFAATKPGSPCINAGMPVAANGGRDFYGNAVNDGSIDIGAFEQLGSRIPAVK